MKILHIASIGLNAEGIGTVISKIVPFQQLLGNDVRIISNYNNLVYNNLDITFIRSRKEFRDFLNSWKPDIVQFHSVYRFPFIGFYRELIKRNIPYVIQMHGALSNENYRKSHLKKFLANKLFFNSYLKNAKSVLFLNQEELDKCAVINLLSSPQILPNGCDKIDNIFFNDNLSEPVDIIFIGRVFMVHKGLDVLCDALDILNREEYDKYSLTFYANPDDQDLPILQEKISAFGNNIRYEGGIYGKDKDARLRKADVFILTSRFEGMPMGLLEALSYGIPAIVTPGTNMSSIIKESNAGWISEFSAHSISNTIKQAVSDLKKHPSFYRKNAYDLGAKYNWEGIAKKLIEIYKKII